MPITYVLRVPVPSDQIQQHREVLEKRVIMLKPRRLNKFHVQSIAYHSQTTQSTIHQVLHSDYPYTCFAIIEPGATQTPSGELKILTSDIGLVGIQRKLAELNILSERKPLQCECQGSVFKLGDFQIRLGAVTQSSSNRGLLVEVTYSSANTNHEAWGVILEFLNSTFGWTQQTVQQDMIGSFVRRKQHGSIYTPEDTIFQYFEHFNALRSAAIGGR